jgi:hypothetical protein
MNEKEKRNPDNGQFTKGNPGGGRPPGTPNKVTRKVKEILQGNAEALTQTLVQKALDGDMGALKVIFSRLLPPVTKDPLDIPPGTLRKVESAEDYFTLVQDTFQLVIDGHITPREAAEIVDLGKKLKKEIENKKFDALFIT